VEKKGLRVIARLAVGTTDGALDGDVCAGADGNTDIRSGESDRVVDPVAAHGNFFALPHRLHAPQDGGFGSRRQLRGAGPVQREEGEKESGHEQEREEQGHFERNRSAR